VINHIDLNAVLRRTVCDLFSDLVTRPTGVAVRDALEQQLGEALGPTLTIIDFSQVGLLDFSCADEIVAKLLLRYCAPHTPVGALPVAVAADAPPASVRPHRDVYFLLSGVSDSHLDAIEAVLERHGLASVARDDSGELMLVGTVDEGERRVWETMCRLGRAVPADLSRAAGLAPEQAAVALEALRERRLVMRFDDDYVAVGAES
jgi:hypothetical protein